MSWTQEREEQLVKAAGTTRPVSRETLANVAEALEVSTRSAGAKLRKMGVEVELAVPRARAFSEEQEAALVSFLENNKGTFTYVEIASQFSNGEFGPKQIQGKILSLELTGSVKAAPKPESTKTYTDEEEATFVVMAKAGKFLEEIAEALDKPLASVRGKALSLNRISGLAIPKQRDKKVVKADVIEELYNAGKLVSMTVQEIAELSGKTGRGVRTIITRRGYVASDYKSKKKTA